MDPRPVFTTEKVTVAAVTIQVGLPTGLLLFEVLSEQGVGSFVEVDGPSSVALRAGHLDLASHGEQCLSDGDPGNVEVDIDPSETGDFAAAGAGHGGEVERCFETVSSDEVEEGLELRRGPVAEHHRARTIPRWLHSFGGTPRK